MPSSSQSSGGPPRPGEVGTVEITGAGVNGTTLTHGPVVIVQQGFNLYSTFKSLTGHYFLVDVSGL